jgi:NADPH:quinone reductase
MKSILVGEFGGPESLKYVEVSEPTVNLHETVVQVKAIGVNFADIHQVENSYLTPQELPFTPGLEVVGLLPSGIRVLIPLSRGGYTQKISVKDNQWVEIPEGVSDIEALSTAVQGLTAWHVLQTMGHLQSGESVVIHAAAGGVGSWAVQLAKMWGAFVIAVTSNSSKAELAKSLGADAFVDPHDKDLAGALIAANNGKKPNVILEMVGGKRFDISLEVLAPFGRLITYGVASRKPPTDINSVSLLKGSKTISGFWLGDCFAEPGESLAIITELINLIREKKVSPVVGTVFPLSEANLAFEAILKRTTVGKVSLDPMC